MLDGHADPNDQNGTKAFYKVNQGTSFLAFADAEHEVGGFARDLVVDYARLSYSNGHIIPLTPARLGFWPFVNKANPEAVQVFGECVGWHRDKIQQTSEWTRQLLDQVGGA